MNEENVKCSKEMQEMMAKIEYLENELKGMRIRTELTYKDGMIAGLKFAIRCNGVSGADVKEGC